MAVPVPALDKALAALVHVFPGVVVQGEHLAVSEMVEYLSVLI